MSERQYCVYILASRPNGTLYTGVTNHLVRRVDEHKRGVADGFTRKYGVKMLVWYEMHQYIEHAILREKHIKKWNRTWKIELIQETNPGWRDLSHDIGWTPRCTAASGFISLSP